MKHNVYSKVMLWVALDRAVRLAFKRSLPAPDISTWIYTRDILKEEILQKGWNSELQCFVQSYDSERMDASNLIMPLVFFLAPTDPLFTKTLHRTLLTPIKGGLTVNHLVFRFINCKESVVDRESVSEVKDLLAAVGKGEGTFTICSFWLVEALARAGGWEIDLLKKRLKTIEEKWTNYY